MKVAARGRDSATYYPGRITLCRTNGTYDIHFKNGSDEEKIPRTWIRPRTSSIEEEPEQEPEEEKQTSFSLDDVIEARYGGKSSYFRGKIVKCRSNGKYDIRYDDGDEETYVAAALIRAIDTDKVSWRKGQAVDARFGGKAAYFSGTIVKVHRDGTCDIEYDDGDEESRVKPSHIRAKVVTVDIYNKHINMYIYIRIMTM
jgi:hypothetical protein